MTGRSHLSQHFAPGAREPAIKGRRRRPIAGHRLPVLLCVRAFVGAALVFVTAGGAIASNVLPAGAATPGDISTVAGNGSAGCSGDGSLATSADLSFPSGVGVDSSGNLVIADTDNNRVSVVAETSGTFYGVAMTAGDMYTVAGQAAVCTGGYSGDGGLATSAQLDFPYDVAVDGSGNLVIADVANNRVRVVAETSGTFYGVAMTAGDIYTVAGNGTGGYSGDGGPATLAELFDPAGVAVDGSGNLVIADALNDRVRVVAETSGTFYGVAMTAGDIYTVAGSDTGGQSGDGGPATSAELNFPQGVAVDGSGNLVIADADNNRVRVVADSTGTFYGAAMTAGDIYTVAGIGTGGSSGDGGPATSAELNFPSRVAVDGSGNLVIADTDNNRVRVVANSTGTFYGVAMTAGDIYTVAGTGTGGYSGDGGPATSAELAGPAGVAVDGSGNLVIADAFNNRIRAVTFTVVTPSITTSQQPATATVGSSIADQATVTGGDNPTGTVTFNLYNNPNGTGTPLFTDTENLVGGVATSAGYTTTATGTDYWVATYNGDSNNSTVTSGTADEPVTVTPAAATHLTVSAPASVTAGSPCSVTVSAEDQFNNLATTYRGTVHFTTTDAGSGVVLPADYTFTSGDNGTHTFTNLVTLATAGPQTVTVTDTTTSSVTGTSGTITVTAATPTIATAQQPATATVGSSIADKATVTGGDNPTGTVTFNLYNNPNGTGTPLFTDTEPLSGGVGDQRRLHGDGYGDRLLGRDLQRRQQQQHGDERPRPGAGGDHRHRHRPPSIAKAFSPASVPLNGTSTLTFTLTNPNGATALTGVAFTDALPSGLVVSAPNGLTDSCAGTASASAGGATISLTGASVAASATCTVAVSVTGTSAGTFTNTTGAVSSANGGTGNTATAVLTVGAPVPTRPGPTTTTTTAPAPLPPFPHANVSYPNGAIVTFGADHYVFAGGRAFQASASELAAVQKVDPAQVLAAPAGASAPTAVAPRPGVTVSTRPVNGNVTIYVVGTDGELHPFATPTQFLGDGYNGALVITVPNLGGLTVGSNAGNTLTALATRADGAIVNSSGTFYTFAGGRAFGIPTPAALQQVRKTNSAAELQGSVPSADTGAPIADGVVLSVAGPVYVSYHGRAVPVQDEGAAGQLPATAAPRLSRRLTPAASPSFSPIQALSARPTARPPSPVGPVGGASVSGGAVTERANPPGPVRPGHSVWTG